MMYLSNWIHFVQENTEQKRNVFPSQEFFPPKEPLFRKAQVKGKHLEVGRDEGKQIPLFKFQSGTRGMEFQRIYLLARREKMKSRTSQKRV